MPREAITGDVPVSHLPFSPAIRAGDFIFVSGQASVDDTGAYVEEDFAGEMERSLANVARILEAAGASMDDIVQVRSFLGDMAYRDEYNRLYPQYFKAAPLPARTTVAGGIGALKYEVDVVAYRPVQADG
ncbi:RidA family protein [Nocardioides marmotae]|uniref:RidA family protein n=1 Tax=Nocardioides marmotae TaxID=2663857 RepID=A0A6I3IVA1_9ACTN|nr:RidA family protein [Nocardioides marmotae]MCR6030729.1 RidA family protein [Gordonia jinghuaiqii]MBC9734006.1 RidA family protein [Nocardioides marmotae]MTB85109.1 RidA family protein [Nocardioides marmotae]MTB94363.1 RidA family protein [Nocardioides marmotae]QKE01610.1 RidA family protein [Nocardioides marmotae]